MFRFLYEKVGQILGFVKDTIVATVKVVYEHIKEVVINSPAVAIMTFASFGLANTLTQLGLQQHLVSIAFVNEVMAVSVISVVIVMILATIAGNIAEARE